MFRGVRHDEASGWGTLMVGRRRGGLRWHLEGRPGGTGSAGGWGYSTEQNGVLGCAGGFGGGRSEGALGFGWRKALWGCGNRGIEVKVRRWGVSEAGKTLLGGMRWFMIWHFQI